MNYQDYIRNFSIIAHIDHGKSTLADRIIENTGLVAHRDMKEQFLDNMDLERERGITIKLQTTRLVYKAKDGNEYIFNLIDTPGHVDFNYEVSRSLAACEGAVLVVDSTQGVEAQTMANVYLALEEDLEILPCLNKIDLASSRPQETKDEIEEMIGIDASDAPLVSAKEGIGIEELLEAIVEKIPAPKGDVSGKLKALIFDSVYDNYKGVVIYARIFDGQVKVGDTIRLMNTKKKYEDLCDHCSSMEQIAANAERASIKYKQVEFMSDKLGQVFDGVISGVTEWGLYVELNENKCEGMIPLRDLDDDYYEFDEKNYCLIGRRNKHQYRLGDPITIRVAQANLARKQLDFQLV